MPLCILQSDTSFNVVVAVDELDIESVALGQTASITVDAVPGTDFTGDVTKISKLGDRAGGVTTFNVTLSVSDPSKLMDNMSASVDINTASKKGVLLVPVEALQTTGSDKYVTVITGSGENIKATQVKVTVGLINDTDAEITSGGENVELSKITSSAAGGLRAMFAGGNRQSNSSSGTSSGAYSATPAVSAS